MKMGFFTVGIAGMLLSAIINLSCASITMGDIGGLIRELPRQNSFKYINFVSLSKTYFKAAYKSLDDPYVYIVLSDTRSLASKLLRFFTSDRYNHVSLAFDSDLKTLISYNGGNGVSKPGLNSETFEHLNRKPGASLAVYCMRVTAVQKYALIRGIAAINREGSSYNFLGLLTGKSKLPNIMFCSQFVYSLMEEVGIIYFDRKNKKVAPMDFVNLDRTGKLQLLRVQRLSAPTRPLKENVMYYPFFKKISPNT
jgi:hypothetical protein